MPLRVFPRHRLHTTNGPQVSLKPTRVPWRELASSGPIRARIRIASPSNRTTRVPAGHQRLHPIPEREIRHHLATDGGCEALADQIVLGSQGRDAVRSGPLHRSRPAPGRHWRDSSAIMSRCRSTTWPRSSTVESGRTSPGWEPRWPAQRRATHLAGPVGQGSRYVGTAGRLHDVEGISRWTAGCGFPRLRHRARPVDGGCGAGCVEPVHVPAGKRSIPGLVAGRQAGDVPRGLCRSTCTARRRAEREPNSA